MNNVQFQCHILSGLKSPDGAECYGAGCNGKLFWDGPGSKYSFTFQPWYSIFLMLYELVCKKFPNMISYSSEKFFEVL